MGMPNIVFRCQMFRGDWDQVWSQKRMLFLMEGLCRVNQTHFQQFEAFKERGLVPNNYPSVYRSGLHYETEKGTEIWPDIPSLLMGTMGKGVYPGNWGDCIPISTLALREDYTVVPFGSLAPGDKIMGDGQFTTVTEHAFTGEKPILDFELNNGSHLRCSPEHRVFLSSNEEVRAEDIKVGHLLRTPTSEFPTHSILNPTALAPEDFAWLLGVYVADGWTDLPRHPRFMISGKDGFKKEEQKRRVESLMAQLDINTRWDKRYIAVNDRSMAEYMKTCGGHAPEKHLPSLLMSRPQVQSVIAGLAADASTANSGTITHGTTSEILALQLRILYRMLGQSVHIKRWDEHGGLGSHPMYRITVRQADDPNHPNTRRNSARVVAIREQEPEMCCDITTDTGRYYLPESDVIVHNCEDLACYRVAELRELPFHYERPAPWNKSKIEVADPRYPQPAAPGATVPLSGQADWSGWKKVSGGIRAKPFAKWRRGPQGNYHYHALTYLPDGRLEDPSLVLGMGKEKAFHEAGMAQKLKDGTAPVILQYAKAPEVMVVDPEKPSGYNGGIAVKLDKKVLDLMAKRGETMEGALRYGDAEMGAYLTNEILLGDCEFDVDAVIGWSRDERKFLPQNEPREFARLLGYSKH